MTLSYILVARHVPDSERKTMTILGQLLVFIAFVVLVQGFGRPSPSTRWRSTRSTTPGRQQTASDAEQVLAQTYSYFDWILRHNQEIVHHIREPRAGGYTLFVPTDAAISNLGQEKLDCMEEASGDDALRAVLQTLAAFHFVQMPLPLDEICGGGVIHTAGGELQVQSTGGNVFVNGVRVSQSYSFEDTATGASVLHETEGLLCPDEIWEILYNHRGGSMPGQPRDFIARRYQREGLDPLSGGQEGFGAIMPSSNLLRNNSPRLLVNLSC